MITSEQLQRRVLRELGMTPHASATDMSMPPAAPADSPVSLPATPAHYTRLQRLKGVLIERLLPGINLTSYNNLRRVRAEAVDAAARAAALEQLAAHAVRERERLRSMLDELEQSNRQNESLLALLERVAAALHDPATLAATRDLLASDASGDPGIAAQLAVYEQASRQNIPYWDIRIAARALSTVIAPAIHVEIGRGWASAQVTAERPDTRCFVFAAWGEGDTDANPAALDLVSIDGGRSLDGAARALSGAFPRIRLGGALIFGDLERVAGPPRSDERNASAPSLPSAASMRSVWRAAARQFPNFVVLECSALQFQAGIALRIR